MPIRALLDHEQLVGPDDVAKLVNVFEETLKTLGLTDREDPVATLIARAIIDAAKRGECDPKRLRDAALKFRSAESVTRNQLLATLSPADLGLLVPILRESSLTRGQVIQEVEAPVERVWFPLGGLVSLVIQTSSGTIVETGAVGREGVIGAFVGLGPWNAFSSAVVQIPGRAVAIAAEPFQQAVCQSERLRNLILHYKEVLLGQVQQAAACNVLHSFEQRLARWLLQAADRTEDASIALTQECLSQMLGVRRTTVTVTALKLQKMGLVRYRRGNIVITNRQGLEAIACECYGEIRRRQAALSCDIVH
jgi:CRP-like cAMP-binding protein